MDYFFVFKKNSRPLNPSFDFFLLANAKSKRKRIERYPDISSPIQNGGMLILPVGPLC